MLKGQPQLLRRAPLRTSIIMFAGLCASLGLIAAPASAAPLASHPSATASASPGGHSSASPDQVIVCTVNVDNPHHSGHNPGTAGAQAQTTCSGPVTSLRMSIGLWWHGYSQGSKTEQVNGKGSIAFGYYVPCTSGGWQATATTLVTWPPGYTPARSDITDTKVASVTC
jgi:hypothetical protein